MTDFDQTSLWKTAFEARADDAYPKERSLLASTLAEMRKNVADLVSNIENECKGLTVHDISHLDALWEMSDLLTGEKFSLNPAETFVLGGAILLHDSAMTAIAYGGIDNLKNTIEWRDIAAGILRRSGSSTTSELIANPPAEILGQITFETLRTLHALQAEKLLGLEWRHPTDGHTIRLLDNSKILEAFGESIGRIAHSHHWDIGRVGTDLRTLVGAGPGQPATWTVNEVKVACLLRCADAAHIDHRRAPTLRYVFNSPVGVSAEHWSFQNKLNQPARRGDRIVYTSRSKFDRNEVDAWWLCVDTLRMIDREISNSNGLLLEIEESELSVAGVMSVESISALSKHIMVSGWRPVNAEIRVSNPVELARTLGGRNLYGASNLAPVKELLQNAVDAIRARRALERLDHTFGEVRITLSRRAGKVWLDVEDNGIGMSERVLTGPLLDFGNSFWASRLMRSEFPGLESSNLKPIGKYGIGFFAIFSLGDQVSVKSRRCDAGGAETRILEFRSISNRPILRLAEPNERMVTASTMVSVQVESPEAFAPKKDTRGRVTEESFSARLRRLVGAVDVNITYRDELNDIGFRHGFDWLIAAPKPFLESLIAPSEDGVDSDQTINAHADLVRTIVGSDGAVYGRAALSLRVSGRSSSVGFVSVGGFLTPVSPTSELHRTFVGVLSGAPDTAARVSASPSVPADAIATWSSDQASLIDRSKFEEWDLLPVSHTIQKLGGDPGSLPYAFCGKTFLSKAQFVDLLRRHSRIDIPLEISYKSSISYLGFSELKSEYFLSRPRENILVVMDEYIIDDLIDVEDTSRLRRGESLDSDKIGGLLRDLRARLPEALDLMLEVWGRDIEVSVVDDSLYEAETAAAQIKSWMISLTKASAKLTVAADR